jgi:rhamnosyltransferase
MLNLMPEAVELVMRSKNDGPLIRATIQNIHRQKFPASVRIVHIDSGSTDQTVDIIRSFSPWKLIQIRPEEYVPGVVLNRGMRETTAEWVVFLNSDAEPADPDWLGGLMAAAQSAPRVGTAFSRQLPRPDCRAVFAHDYDRCFGLQRESVHWEHFFSMVSCIVNRRAWTEQPFREDLKYAEDDEWSKRLRTHGWEVVFAQESRAIHSHNYTLRESYKRCRGDTFASAATSPTPPRNYNYHYTVALGSLKDAAKDWAWCRRAGRLGEWPHALAVRFAQRLGKRDGYRAGWKHYRRDQPATGAVSA